MKKLFLRMLLSIIFLLSVAIGPTLAQDDEIDFIPFSSDIYGIVGIVPQGWTEVAPGTFARASSAIDAVVLAQQAAPLSATELLDGLLPQLLLTEAPASSGSYRSDAFEWTLYYVLVEVPGQSITVDLALAETDGITYLVLLQAPENEYEALHSAVFLPLLDALRPMTDTDPSTETETETAPDLDLPYQVEEVTFGHGEITLAGTLTLPEGEGPHPAMILITGSGAQDRDESLAPIAEIKPFYLIADHLTRAGVAVLRYDDRGVGQSTGDFAAATTLDFADDTESALDYLQSRSEINSEQIGLLGHSEGSNVAAILGARRPDVAFVISMGGPSVDGLAIMQVQLVRILEASGTDAESIARQSELQVAFLDAILTNDVEAQAQTIYDLTFEQLQALPEDQLSSISDLEAYIQGLVNQQLSNYQTEWWRVFLTYDPAEDWAQIDAPILALLGGLDVQVDAEQNAPVFERIFEASAHPDYTIIILPDANHLFQAAITGNLDEYGSLAQTFTADFLPTITDWLLARVTLAE